MKALREIIREAGFYDLYVMVDEVTDAYAMKWGHGLMIKEFIQSGLFVGKK
ncbi:MAG: hypothetical protein ACOX00_09685 [Peptoniphilaceae bacterium]|nr:methyltransferase [Bacillota bacterium]